MKKLLWVSGFINFGELACNEVSANTRSGFRPAFFHPQHHLGHATLQQFLGHVLGHSVRDSIGTSDLQGLKIFSAEPILYPEVGNGKMADAAGIAQLADAGPGCRI